MANSMADIQSVSEFPLDQSPFFTNGMRSNTLSDIPLGLPSRPLNEFTFGLSNHPVIF